MKSASMLSHNLRRASTKSPPLNNGAGRLDRLEACPMLPIASLRKGDSVEFYGEYEWNAKGGVVHWTHHDPKGSHVGGWLKQGGRTYQ